MHFDLILNLVHYSYYSLSLSLSLSLSYSKQNDINLSLKSMKKTIGYRSTSKKPVSPSKVNTPSSKQPVTNQMYFCHYRNAMYMGPVKNFKKDGKGILIHDNGLSLISNYSNDLMHGHNVFYAQHCLLSAEYARGRLVEAVYRTDGFMAFMFFNS